MSFHNVQAIELLWTLIALVGLIFAALNFRAATRTVRYIKSLVPKLDKESWRTARSIQTAETYRFLIQAIYVAIGIVSFSLPPGDISEVPLRFRISAFVIRWGLVLSATLTAMQSINSYRLRKYFLQTEEDTADNE